jgi:sigma-B regulation protein RsbU (phosphoserine phosphatase)
MSSVPRKLTSESKAALLLEISRRSRGTLDLEETLNLLLDSIATVIDYDAAGFFALNDPAYSLSPRPEGRIAGVAQRGFLERPVGEDEMLTTGKGIVGDAMRNGDLVILPDVRLDSRYIVGRKETLSEVAVPISVGGRTIAALNLESDRLGAFDGSQREILLFFAEAAALAIEKAMLHRQLIDREQMETQLRLARDVQLGLLPDKPPTCEGYDLTGVCIPSLELGGDYYDFFPFDDGRLGLVIGDVAGKGVPAALTMATFRALLRARRDMGPALSDVAFAVNRLLRESSAPRSFVTGIYATLEPESGRLTYVSCGHPLAIVARSDGSIEELDNSGPVLGAFDDARYEERLTTLRPGDVLLLYTDGLVEAVDESGGLFGVERTADALRETRNLAVTEISRSLIGRARAFTDSDHLADDVTLVLLKRL